MKNRFFIVPILFDSVKLNKDMQVCLEKKWSEHFNKKDYTGSWTSIALRSATGGENDIYSHPRQTPYSDTPLLGHCPYFQEVMEAFRCEMESVRLLRLDAGSQIKVHRDLQAGYQYNTFRLHIPIQTGKKVSFVVDDCELEMKAGECWYADFSLPHHVVNNGKFERIHLVLDYKRNSWSDDLFRKAGYDFDEESRSREYSRETKEEMISLLGSMNTSTSHSIAEQMKKDMENRP